MALPATEISAALARPRRRRGWMVLAALVAAVPLGLTLAGALTSPPHVAGPPVGRLVFLDADQPSVRTTMLRGLFVLTPDGQQRQLIHEIEGQDTEDPREWITQPAASPDGTKVAFVKQIITLKEENRSVVNQIWVMPIDGGGKPKLLLDLTKNKIKQIVGLAWTSDSKDVIFLNDETQYAVNASDGKVTQATLLHDGGKLRTNADISATRNPNVSDSGWTFYTAQSAEGTDDSYDRTPGPTGRKTIFRTSAPPPDPAGKASLEGNFHDGIRAAQVRGNVITVTVRPMMMGLDGMPEAKKYVVQWGWSAFGGRKITSLKWSPNGKYLGYTVSKPPVPEDELFYLDTATGETYQLPVRTGRAAWDWSR